jgi:hypothetical protein
MEQIGINGQGPKDSMNLGPDVCDKNIKGFVSVIRDTGQASLGHYYRHFWVFSAQVSFRSTCTGN